jgi:hypothetical protein
MKRYILRSASPNDSYLGVWNRVNNERKAMDVFAGLCLGILADGEINDREARFLHGWIKFHSALLPEIIVVSILESLYSFMNGLDTSELENENLIQILNQILGGQSGEPKSRHDNLHHSNPACGLIFDTICATTVPSIVGLEIVVSGSFLRGGVSDVAKEISRLGGVPRTDAPREKTSFLVIGEKGSSQWATTLIGNKAQKALEMKQRGHAILIIREVDFFTHLQLLTRNRAL